MFKLCLTVALLLNLTAFAQTKKIAIIGSSTAEGQGSNPLDSSWVRRLSYLYKNQEGKIDTIYNLARGGSNNYHGMPTSYVPALVPYRDKPSKDSNITRALSFNPDIVIVSYVSNNLDAYTIAETMFTLQVIMDSAHAAGKLCFITTTQPRTSFDAAGRERLRILKDSILNRFGDYAINFFDPVVNPADNTIATQYRFAFDNVHLNNAGHRILLQQVVAKSIFDFNPLPVVISNFNGKIQNNQALLQWTSYDEEPFTTYTVQRSINGIQFESMRKIDATDAPGKKKYSFVDKSPLSGTNYYRLLIEQPSGNAYSKVIAVKNELSDMVIKKIYPTRVDQTITLEIYSPKIQTITLDIVSSYGAKVKSFTRVLASDKNIIQVPAQALSAGTYFLRIVSPGRAPVIQTFVK